MHEAGSSTDQLSFKLLEGMVFLYTIRHSIYVKMQAGAPACRPDHFTRSGDSAKEGRVARSIEPMESMPVEKIPEGHVWSYELKLDGYRLVAAKTNGSVMLYSRRGSDLSKRFKQVVSGLASLPEETVIDGEIVALDEQGKPDFNLLRNFRSVESPIMLYALSCL
jgi:ATP-dependent DNA ligase